MSALAVVTARLPPSSMAAAVKIIRCIFCPLSLLPRLAQGEPCGFETYHFAESNHTIFHKKMNSLFVIVFILFPLSRMFLFHSQHLSIFMIKVSAAALRSSASPLLPPCDCPAPAGEGKEVALMPRPTNRLHRRAALPSRPGAACWART